MKQLIEQLSAESAEGEDTASEDTAGISSVLVRDSQADADIARCVAPVAFFLYQWNGWFLRLKII